MFRIALKFLRFDRPKTLGALFGCIISVFLIGQQCGIFIFLTQAISCYVRNNDQYIWITDAQTTNANALVPLDMRISRELASVKGVSKVYPIVIAGASAKFADGTVGNLSLFGVQPPEFVGGLWNLDADTKARDLLQDGAVFTDYFDRKLFGDAVRGEYFELNGNKVFIAGNTKGNRSFGGGAIGFTTIERARAITKLSNNKASAFLVTWQPDLPQSEVIANIKASISSVNAWNGKDLTQSTIITVLKSSGIAISFGTLIFFALIVGFVIIGLTLYSSAIDRIKDYGTLKAIGATNGYVRKLIVTQALIVAVVGFVIGTALVEGFRNGIAKAGTLFDYPLWLRFVFFGITIFIAVMGSMFAIKRIVSLEPAQVFRG